MSWVGSAFGRRGARLTPSVTVAKVSQLDLHGREMIALSFCLTPPSTVHRRLQCQDNVIYTVGGPD